MNKLTDSEIVKALECCSWQDEKCCEKCPLNKKETNTFCSVDLMQSALDLINRQKAEIEKLIVNMNAFGLGMKIEAEKAEKVQAEIERLQIRNKTLSAITRNYDWKFAKAKSDAIKEFAERLKEELRLNTENNGGFVPSMIDNLVKEMAGVDNG